MQAPIRGARQPARDDRAIDLARYLRATDHVVIGEGPGEPRALMRRLIAQRADLSGISLFMGLGAHQTLLPEHLDHLRLRSYGALGTMRRFGRDGLIEIVPCNLGQVPAYIKHGTIPCHAVFVQLSPKGPDGRHSLGVVNLHMEAAIARARIVIAEINDAVPYTFGGRTFAPEELDVAISSSEPLPEPPVAQAGAIERAIAGHVSQFIDNGSVLQIGIGAVPAAVIEDLSDRRDLGVHSGVIGDGVLHLIERGIVTNGRKRIDKGITVTGMLLGSRKLHDFAHRNRAIAVRSAEYTHDPAILGAIDRLVTLNSAIEVDLTGQVNAEVAAGSYIGAVGGHGEFVRAGHRSEDGHSIIALPSAARDGSESRIRSVLRGPVTSARADVDIIVTEYGAAELRGQPIAERIRRMIAVAHPDFREELSREAHMLMRRGF